MILRSSRTILAATQKLSVLPQRMSRSIHPIRLSAHKTADWPREHPQTSSEVLAGLAIFCLVIDNMWCLRGWRRMNSSTTGPWLKCRGETMGRTGGAAGPLNRTGRRPARRCGRVFRRPLNRVNSNFSFYERSQRGR